MHLNSHLAVLHQLTATQAFSYLPRLEKQVMPSFRDNTGHPRLPSLKVWTVYYCPLFPLSELTPVVKGGGG